MNHTEEDILKSIFSRMQDETLPPTFQSEMMQRIRKEAVRIARRNRRLYVLALVSAVLFTIGLSVAAIAYLSFPQFTTGFPQNPLPSFPQISIPPFYIIFGFLVLILLFADHLLRQTYYKKHPG